MTAPKKAGVIGWPIAQSRSPLIHQTWLKELGLQGAYEKYAVKPEDLQHFIQKLQQNGFAGLNLTIPHKQSILPLVDDITDDARAIGAANTIWFEGDKLIGGNTDAYGFVTHLKESAPLWQPELPAVLLGAGGACRAVIHALQQEGVKNIILTNRTAERAAELARDFGPSVQTLAWSDRNLALDEAGLLVNTTSLGMVGKPSLEIDISGMPKKAVVYDIVYAPLETPLLKAAKTANLSTVDGLGMLLHQAVPGFEKWFGARPEVTKTLYAKVLADINGPAP